MSNEVLAQMCKEMEDELISCLRVLESPVEHERNLQDPWPDKIIKMYMIMTEK